MTDKKHKFTPKQEMFIREYLIDLNATQAAIRAGYSGKNAFKIGSELLQKTTIQQAIKKQIDKRAERTEITADKVLQRWWDIATADPNEIIHLRRVCCRHCYGEGFQYQWLNGDEYTQAVDQAVRMAKEGEAPQIPSDSGGYGFNRLLEPHSDCPYCMGEGHPEMFIEDTRKLNAKARLLFAGIKQTQSGIEVKFQDQGKALENIAKHLGMFVDRHEISGKDGQPINIISSIPRPGSG